MAPRAPTTKPTRARAMRVECFAIGDLDAEKRETWIQVGKTGEWFRDGRKVSLSTADLESMVAKFSARKNDMVLDYEHKTHDPDAPKAPAAGWIKELEVRADGTQLWARVKFTREAAEEVRSEKYRYTSPAFVGNTENRETGKRGGCELCSVGMTNDPFLDGMEPMALRRNLMTAASDDGAGETDMDETIAKLLEITGAADAAALIAWVEGKAKAPEKATDEKADEETEKMKRTLDARDAELEILRARVTAFEKTTGETDDERADRAVTDAIKAKRATESERVALRRLFLADRPAFEALTKRAVVPSPQVKGPEKKPGTEVEGAPSEVPALFVESMKATGVTDPKAVAAAWAKNGPKGRKAEV